MCVCVCVCVCGEHVRMCVFRGGACQQGKAVFIQSVPCLYHVVGKPLAGSQSGPRGHRGRPRDRHRRGREREVGHRGWPRNLLVDVCVCVRTYVRVCSLSYTTCLKTKKTPISAICFNISDMASPSRSGFGQNKTSN